jgi:hypothetical protein
VPPGAPSDDDIEVAMYNGYIDYLNGRCLKTHFTDMASIDPFLYDRDAGTGKFASIVEQLRYAKAQ